MAVVKGFSPTLAACMLLLCANLVEVFHMRADRDPRSTKDQLEITEFHVKSTVVSRYAHTTITSSVLNSGSQASDATFQVDLPSSAFISNFTIISNGKEYVSQVKGKHVAKKIYDEAKEKGQTAGLVATRMEFADKFSIDVSIPPGEHLSFKLSFEQLLARRFGRYELVLGLRPTQPVQNLTVDVSITERTGLSFVRVLPLRTHDQQVSNTLGDGGNQQPPPTTTLEQLDSTSARVFYNPTKEQQASSSPTGLNADFVIEYDVILTDLIGDVQVYDGYFVHYFAPRELPVVPKEVIFVIDVSGSMEGDKLKQTKEAMTTILGDLRSHDNFNIITFATSVRVWQPNGTVPATAANIRAARAFTKKMKALDSTDINSALVEAGRLLQYPPSTSSTSESRQRGIPMIIFLTDGAANAGVTNEARMRLNVREALRSTTLFALAFGRGADYNLLRKLSLDNRGVARRVYWDSKVSLQLRGFYDEVASPLLSEVQLIYGDDQAFDVTRSSFSTFFQGSELVVAGRVHPGVQNLGVTLNAYDTKKHLTLENNIPVPEVKSQIETKDGMDTSSLDQEQISGFVQRLWAYFTIKELLLQAESASDTSAREALHQNATSLALKYNFVTPVTSLVVVKPNPEAEETGEPTSSESKPKQRSQTDTRKSFASSVDGDPHFLVHLPRLERDLCFTIDGHANDTVRLVEDSETGIIVNGHLMWAPPEVGHEAVERTYFDQVVISKTGPDSVVVIITLDFVKISQRGQQNQVLPTIVMGSVQVGPDIWVEMDEHLRCWVNLGPGIRFLLLFHHYKHPNYMQLDHLGFYIAQGNGLSKGTQGLLGQFQHANILIKEREGNAALYKAQDRAVDALAFGTLRRGEVVVPVILRRKMMKDTVRKRHPGVCWEVSKDNVDKILAQPYQAYILATDGLSHHTTH